MIRTIKKTSKLYMKIQNDDVPLDLLEEDFKKYNWSVEFVKNEMEQS